MIRTRKRPEGRAPGGSVKVRPRIFVVTRKDWTAVTRSGQHIDLNDSLKHPTAAPAVAGLTVQTTVADPKLMLIALRTGRMANRIVLFANFIALAAEHGYRLVNVAFHSYAELFEATRGDIYCRYPRVRWRSRLDSLPGLGQAIRKTRLFYHVIRSASRINERWPLFGPRVVTVRESADKAVSRLDAPEFQNRIRPARLVFVYGWRFRAPAYVERHADEIRDYFRPVESIATSSRDTVDRLRMQADVVAGVHVRHGDYRTWKGGKCFFPASQYAGWMRSLAEEFPGKRVAFLVCSDEPRRPEEFPGLSVALGTGSAAGDLYALAGCDFILGPLSTFTQWASFYGNKPLFHLRSGADRPVLSKFAVSRLDEVP